MNAEPTNMRSTRLFLLLVTVSTSLLVTVAPLHAAEKLKVLLIDGQNNHDWKHTTPVLKWILEDCGRFTVDVSTTPPSGPKEPKAPKGDLTPLQKAAHENAVAKWKLEKDQAEKGGVAGWQQWHPKFSDYAVVVSNYNGEEWPESVRKEFVEYIHNGGGFVSVHAADNSFADWPEYNQMIGVGGWGGRNEKNGPMIRFKDGKFTRDETPGAGGAHGAQHEFLVETREPEHPIMKGLPSKWMAATDELYSKLRGPAENMTVLATAYSAPETHGTGENEPILMVISFGKGRVFHTTLGHSTKSLEGLGDQVSLQRGTEWAATGNVTLPPPPEGALKADHAALNPPPASIDPTAAAKTK
jgi:type 1 glutamine amidotransferase